MNITKSAMITIAGRPNVGKSTLTNALVGEKVSIVTGKPQTTRSRICGVRNRGGTQLVFMDTPGFHKPRSRLGDYMVKVVNESVEGVDAVVLMVEPVDSVGTQEKLLIGRLKEMGVPSVLVINKIDTVKKEKLLSVIAAYGSEHGFDAVVPVSAKTGDGINELLDELEKFAGEGPQLFPDGMISDQNEKQLAAELVREKLLICLEREVPHGIAVEVTRFGGRENGVMDIETTIYCEKESHKGIIIGKDGLMLKKIGELARLDMENRFGAKVYLKIWVKVKENWRDNRYQLRNFGYE